MSEIRHIMDLPDEVLDMIFQYLPKQQLILGQVCKRFHEISCLNTDCKMEIDSNSQYKLVDNIDSILDSKRRVTELTIVGPCHWERIDNVFEKFGHGIKEIRLDRVSLTSYHFLLLNHAYNLSRLDLMEVELEGKIPKNFKLNLSKLKILSVRYCNEKTLKALDSLSDDVLTDLTLECYNFTNQKHFQNQRKIRFFKGHGHLINYCELVDLESLDLSRYHGICVNTEKLNMICDLGNLKELKIEVGEIDFSAVEKLKNLKKFKVKKNFGDFNETEFRTLRSKTIEEISVVGIKLSGVENISFGCPNIRKIDFYHSRLEYSSLNTILMYFPRLESLAINIDSGFGNRTGIIEGPGHENLKELSIRSSSNLTFNIENCNKLEKLSLNLDTINESLVNFMSNQPSLKLLFLEGRNLRNEQYLSILKRAAVNIDGIVYNTFHDYGNQISFENLPIVEIKEDMDGYYKETIFKRNKDVDVFKKIYREPQICRQNQ